MKNLLILLMSLLIFGCDKPQDQELVMSIDMVRHGDRAPVIWVPEMMGGIWKQEEIDNLTTKGFEESKLLGEYFKKYYINDLKFLPEGADPELVYVRSTNYQRTKETARAIIEGMFGDSSKNLIIRVLEKKDDPAFAMSHKYRTISDIVNTKLEDEVPKELKNQLLYYLNYINNTYHTNFTNIVDMVHLGDAIYVSKIHNKKLLEVITGSDVNKIIELYKKSFLYGYSGMPARNCYKSRDSLEEIVDFLSKKISDQIKIKYILLSIHDVSIMAMLRMFNFSLAKPPKYNANLRFELVKSNDRFFVKIKYDQETIKVCKSELCPVEEFRSLIAERIKTQCSDFNIDQNYLKVIGIEH